jgi:hypothetical protein
MPFEGLKISKVVGTGEVFCAKVGRYDIAIRKRSKVMDLFTLCRYFIFLSLRKVQLKIVPLLETNASITVNRNKWSSLLLFIGVIFYFFP